MNIATVKKTDDWADRGKAAIWGQFLGDAACLGAHWIYDLNELGRRFPQGVAGFEQPAEGHYHAGKRSGDLTHYGDAALLMLQSVAELGYFSEQDFGQRFVAFFSSREYHGYLDHATKGTLANCRAFAEERPGVTYHFQGGADDDQPATATRLTPVIVSHFRDAKLLKVVENATRVCQNNQRAIVYMKCHAIIIEEILAGRGLGEAFKAAAKKVSRDGEMGKEVAAATETVFTLHDLEVREATLRFGQVCPLKSSFPAAMHCALKHEGDLRRAIMETADAGGDNAARAAMIGSWLGALHGTKAIPEEWQEKVHAREEIDRCIDQIVARGATASP